MIYKEILKRLKRRIKTSGVKLVEENWNRDYVGGTLFFSYDEKKPEHITFIIKLRIPHRLLLHNYYLPINTKQLLLIQKNAVKNIINKDTIDKVICLLHELGHFEVFSRTSLFEKQRLLAAFTTRRLRGYYPEEIIQNEKDAWDEGWKIAIDLGLNKNENFKKKFQEEKIAGLRSYEHPNEGVRVHNMID